MNTRAFIIAFLVGASSFGCAKNSSSDQSRSGDQKKAEVAQVQLNKTEQISSETDADKRTKLLIESMTSETNKNDINSIISLYKNNKITTEEFRSLFWNSSLSPESLSFLKDDLSFTSKLDKLLVQSMTENTIAFEELLNEVKSDSEPLLPMPLQSKLIEELTRLYNKNFQQINSNEVLLYERLSSNDESKKSFLKNLKHILELNYFQNILSTRRLVTAQNLNAYIPRDLNVKMGFDYSNIIGRCGEQKGHLDLVKIKTDLSVNCPTETPSQAMLALNTNVYSMGDGTLVSARISSGVVGGYRAHPAENQTTIQNYSLAGKIIIPKCKNPSFCSQIVTISNFDDGMVYNNQTNSGISVTINGINFSLNNDSKVSIDVSQKDAVIELSMTGSKKHIGACCSNPVSTQKIGLYIENDGYSPTALNLTKESLLALNTFSATNAPKVVRSFINDFNTPTYETLVVEAKIKEAIKDKFTIDNYRSIFYGRLMYSAMAIDSLMLNNNSPLDILHYNETRTSISDRVGRTLIYPIIQSKLLTYQNSMVMNLQSNINEMFKSVLNMNLNNEITKSNLINLITSSSRHFNEKTRAISQEFINSINSNTKDQSDLLNEMKKFQSEYSLMIKKASLELKLLNLEQAQFAEIAPVKTEHLK